MNSFIYAFWAFAFILGFAGFSPNAIAQDFTACKAMFPGGIVPKPASRTVQNLCKITDNKAIFAIRFDTTRKTPNWLAHKLSPAEANGQTKRKRPKFSPDPDIISADQAIDKSYVKSGFSRGHIVPAADMSWSLASYKDTFRFSNVVPQMQRFNAGVWLGMEDKLRKLVKARNVDIWDFSGVYGQVQTEPSIGKYPNDPVVPKCFYKIFVAKDKDSQKYKVMTALYHWDDYTKLKTWAKSVTSLARVKMRTGIDFLEGLALEDTYDATFWGVKMPQNIGDCA